MFSRMMRYWQELSSVTDDNGLHVVVARRPKSPIVELRFIIEGGFAGEPELRSGLAGLAMAMLSEGALRVEGKPLVNVLESLGATIHGQITADASIIGMSALAVSYRDALAVFGQIISKPQFLSDDFERVRANRLALITRERLDPPALAMRVLPPMLYGSEHPYARPFSGSGTARALGSLTPDDLRDYYAGHLAAPCTLVAAGDCDTTEPIQTLKTVFGTTRTDISPPVKPAAAPACSEIMIIDRPGSSQAWLVAGLATVARNSPMAEALIVADAVLGGMFASRLNLNLREARGWTYGVRSSLIDARLQGLWLIRTAVSKANAGSAMAEMAREIENLAGTQPCRQDEFDCAVDYLAARMPSRFESCAQIADALTEAAIHHLPAEYHARLPTSLRRLNPGDVTEICRQIIAQGCAPRWIVVADAHDVPGLLSDNTFGKLQLVHSDDALP